MCIQCTALYVFLHWFINSEDLRSHGEKGAELLCYSSHKKKSLSVTHIRSCLTDHDYYVILRNYLHAVGQSSPLKSTFKGLLSVCLFIFLLTDVPKASFPPCWVKLFQVQMKMCYLFFFLSFLLLLVELWAAFEWSAEAWPLVFRWSNNLFRVGNS